MKALTYLLILAFVIYLIVPAETKRRRGRFWRKVKKAAKKAKDWLKTVGKKFCKIIYGIKCPWNRKPLDALKEKHKLKALKNVACKVHKVAKKVCRGKRSITPVYDLYPFPENFQFYDNNKDKMISFHEFQMALVQTFNLKNPMDLEEPFLFADMSGDGKLDTDEFKGGPFLFSDGYFEQVQSRNYTMSPAA